MLEVEEKRLETQSAVIVRATARADAMGPVMGELLPAVFAFVQASDANPAGPPFSRYLSMEGPEWEFECGMAVNGPVEAKGRFEVVELPGGDVVTTTHVGPYDTLGQSWDALGGWLAEQGKVGGGPPWELYLTDPGEVQNPAEWRTELVMPLGS